MQRSTSLKQVIGYESSSTIFNLSSESQILAGLLMLIVDINYRVKYGSTVAKETASGYHDDIQLNNVVADQILPVDNGLLRH